MGFIINYNMKKNFFKRLKIGISKGWNTPTLPQHLLTLQLHPLIRIFRVIGGISILLILTKRVNYFNSFVLYLVVLISIFYTFYILYISYYRLRHIYKIMKSKDLEIRNSPLDKFATLASKLIFCVKGACDTAVPLGVALGVMAGFDTILEHKGKEPIFLPFIAEITLPDSEEQKIYKERKNLLKDIKEIDSKYKQLYEDSSILKSLEDSKLFSDQDITTIREEFKNQENIMFIKKEVLLEGLKNNFRKN
jgi:hypothetical protein